MSYLDDSLAQLKIFEDSVPWMYLDTNAFVTVGVGEMLRNAAVAQSLAFVDSNQQPVTPDVILAEFNRVSALPSGKNFHFYGLPDSPTLQTGTIDSVLMNHLNEFDADLSARFPDYPSFPDAAKLGLLDMIFNLGQKKLFNTFPHFMGCVDNQDWLGASEQCHRVGPNQARNDWTKQQFLAAANQAG